MVMREIRQMFGWGKVRSMKVVADEAWHIVDGAGIDILAEEDDGEVIWKADVGGLKLWSLKGANEGRVVCEVTEFF